ncbi:MAG: hypothetical protein QOD92_2142 [Acidimicrobiaceae bacterium]
MWGILFADVVGSSQLRSRLGDDRADQLRRDHDDLLGSAVAAHDGTVLRWTGDGVKASFASASAAVGAALDMQRAVMRYVRSAEAVAPFQLRIGVAAGEVTDDDGDIHGVAVIEAARLEAIAEAGEILVTELVQLLGQRRLSATFEPVGVRTLKGLDEPVSVLRVLDPSAGASDHPLPRAVTSDQRFPLVGRSDELDRAIRRWDDVRTAGHGAILLAGPPGIGKSRFISDFVARAHHDGALVLAGVCDSDLAVPYQPFTAALREVTTVDEELAAAVAGGESRLGPLFPARLVGNFEDAGPAARFALFDAVALLLDRLARDQPVVLVLEDVHWASSATVQLLHHLVSHPAGRRVLIVASYRPDDLTAEHPLHELLADVRLVSAVTRIELHALDVGDVVELVAASTPDAPTDAVADFARRVCEESGGNAFFVCELLRHLAATGDLDRLVATGAGAELPVPESVRDVVAQRLARLPADVNRILANAAVIGLAFDLDVLATVVEARPDDVLEVLEDLQRVALVDEVSAGRFAFAHAIVRGTLLDAMGASRRALAHHRVADAIEATGRPDHDELAHHWLQAGVEAKANASRLQAARRDLEALAYESAALRAQTVLDSRAGGTDVDPVIVAAAWLTLGLARRALGQADYIAAIEQAGRLGRRLGDLDLVTEAALASVWPGTYFVMAGREPGLVELGEAALDLVAGDDARRPRLLATLAAHLVTDDDRARRIALLEEAHAGARAAGDPALIGSVLVAEYVSLWDPSTFARRAAITSEVTRLARASGDGDLEFFAGFFAAFGAAERGQVVEARRLLDALAGPIAASRNFYFGFLADRLGVSLDILVSRADVQTRIDDLATRYAGTHADTTGTWSLQTGGVALQMGNLGDLAPAVGALIEQSQLAPNWRVAHGLALLDAGDRVAAMAALDTFEEPTFDSFWLTTMQIAAELAIRLDRTDVALRVADRLRPYGDQLGITASGSLCLGLVATTLGDVALNAGDHEAAIGHLGDAVTHADAMGAVFESVRARRLLASALLATGHVADAGSLVLGALAQAEDHGFARERRLLAALGARASARP